MNPEHRQKVLKDSKGSYLYNLLNDKKVKRILTPVLTGLWPTITDGSPEEVLDMRLSCILHKVILMSFLLTLMPDNKNTIKDILLAIGPWVDEVVPWAPANGNVPIKEAIVRPTKAVEVDPERKLQQKQDRYADEVSRRTEAETKVENAKSGNTVQRLSIHLLKCEKTAFRSPRSKNFRTRRRSKDQRRGCSRGKLLQRLKVDKPLISDGG